MCMSACRPDQLRRILFGRMMRLKTLLAGPGLHFFGMLNIVIMSFKKIYKFGVTESDKFG